MDTVTYKDVDEYITKAAPEVQPKLKELRTIIREVVPEAEEKISYGIPGYFYHGRLVYFGGFKNHVSLFGAGRISVEKHHQELKKYKTSKGTIQFPLDEPLPIGLIKKLVRERVKENEIDSR